MMVQLSLWGDYPSLSLPASGEGTESVIREMRWLNRRCGPVSAAHLSGFVGKSPRMTQYYLNRLEAAGMVRRVGQRSGWVIR